MLSGTGRSPSPAAAPAAVPAWIDDSSGKLQQFEKYVCTVFGLPDLFASFVDTQQNPLTSPTAAAQAVLRMPSINALERGWKTISKLVGRRPTCGCGRRRKLVVTNVLDELQLQGRPKRMIKVINEAERNEAFATSCSRVALHAHVDR